MNQTLPQESFESGEFRSDYANFKAISQTLSSIALARQPQSFSQGGRFVWYQPPLTQPDKPAPDRLLEAKRAYKVAEASMMDAMKRDRRAELRGLAELKLVHLRL